jgi:hypothetical protein
MKKLSITPLQFAKDYATRSGVDFQLLADKGFVVIACEGGDCDWANCTGWVMETQQYIDNCDEGQISISPERYYLKDMVENDA